MTETYVTCTNCGTKIPLGKALMAPIEEKLRKEIEGSTLKKQQELAEVEVALRAKEEGIDRTVEQTVAERLKALEGKIRTQIDGKYSTEIKDLQQALEEKKEKLSIAEDHELALRKKTRELEDREKSQELEMTRRIDEERKTIAESTRKQMQEENRLKDEEHQEKIRNLSREVEDLNRKLQQGPVHLQGEALETMVEDSLRQCFTQDIFEPVSKGVKGPDLVQKIRRSSGEVCGTVAWEMKRTKGWKEDWIDKLKSDLPAVDAQLGIIVTETLPEGIRNFGFKRGVIVTNYDCFVPVAALLRTHIIELYRQKLAGSSSEDKKDALYDYLLSSLFRQRVESIAEPLINMKRDLDKEARAMERSWSKRDKQIEKAVIGVARMYGDMQGIVGNNLPSVKILSLPESGDLGQDEGSAEDQTDNGEGKK
jgi:hypothetical protein